MREIHASEIAKVVKSLCIEANLYLGEDVLAAFDRAEKMEESPVGKEVFEQLKENARIAREEQVAICQDTGLAVVFVELGQEVHIFGGDFNAAINEGVKQGYQEGYLRKSACHCFSRANTRDNTPAVIHVEMVPGDKVKITVAPKGGGSENMSMVTMLSPSDGIEGIKNRVVEWVKQAGSNPCPPIVVGVGIGGTFEQTALIAKKALLRTLGEKNPDPKLAALEEELLTRINNLGIGPQGLGGRFTALAVHVEMIPCHIASFPMAVNINCHAHRHKEAVI
ncbi:MAG: fumarate hydratase [Thermodesulfobacteriota bacterium]|nr:fumarate hydratase [Thermodesulfobacteriota bacterium]